MVNRISRTKYGRASIRALFMVSPLVGSRARSLVQCRKGRYRFRAVAGKGPSFRVDSPTMKRNFLAPILLGVFGLGGASSATSGPLRLREPTISRTHLVFNYGGDLWIADRDGGTARHLTSGIGQETNPSFS